MKDSSFPCIICLEPGIFFKSRGEGPMKRINILWSGIILLTLVLAACGQKATPTTVVTEPPVIEPATEIPPPTETAAAEPTPTLVPINLAGPEMAVGSTFLYIDGSTLV